jgi:tartrate-resistant acid phosphatase type 5
VNYFARNTLLIAGLWLWLLLPGCARADPAMIGPTAVAPTAVALTPLASPVATLPAASPPPLPSPSATAPATPTPTSTPIPTATLTATSTPTPAPTLTSAPTPLRFAVIGDYGQVGQPAQDVSDLVRSRQPEFIITTGDNNYPSGAAETIDDNIGQYYGEFIYPYRGRYGHGAGVNRFFPSLGNHDYHPVAGIQPYLDYFSLPGNGRYYDFIWGPVHFFALNSDWREPDGIHRNSAQAIWLREALAASTAPWRLVYMHVPPYSSGWHGSAEVMQWPFAEWGASAVLAGHDHTYERLLVDGIPYFVNGLGGHPARYAFTAAVEGSQEFFNDDYGAMLVEATETQITFHFITRSGELIDSSTLTRPAR